MERNSIHREIKASYSVFEYDGRVFVQIDSFGTEDRQIPGKKSQTIQLDRQGAEALVKILKTAFSLD
jgi:hypothetical protein